MRRLTGLAAILAVAATAPAAQPPRDVILATTTSVYDTGLLDALLPAFERASGYRVKTIPVGTGQALALAARGEADLVLAHAPDLERRYVREGVLVRRRAVMTNEFLLAGPPGDPAGARGAPDPGAGFRAVAARGLFVSRGDSSGTHLRELRLWTEAGARPPRERYLEVGQGMAATLRVASERGGYVLTDRATFLALRPTLRLVPVVEHGAALRNLYSVSEVNPDRFPLVNGPGAAALAAYFLSAGVQQQIAAFGVEAFGEALFVPAAGQEAGYGPDR